MVSIAPQTAQQTPVHVKKLGHLVYEVSDIDRSTRFWTEILGFTVSDTNDLGMVFLRCAGDHHSIALVPSEKRARPPAESGLRFHHLAMEVGTLDELFAFRTFLRERNVPITYEGRRGPGGNIGIEFVDPDGFEFEVYVGMDQIGPDGRTRPAAHFRRARTLEDAVANPLPETW